MNDRIISGAAFCQVDRIRHAIHEIDDITEGYHRWHGTIPSFRVIDISSMKYIMLAGVDVLNHIDILLIRRTLEPSACAKKYLIAASVSWNFLEFIRIGINLNRFSSMAAHKNSQFDADIAIRVLEIMIVIDRM
jgi:hypothetical protein